MNELSPGFAFELNKTETIRIGVIADTHVPDRVGALHPDVISRFTELKVDLILHAGDISTPKVLQQLQKVAPVVAVRGNRDWLNFSKKKLVNFVCINNVKIALMHGHFGLGRYLLDKIPFYTFGYQFERYPPKLKRHSEDSQIIVFGHTHHSESRWVENCLYFNPGSAYEGNLPNAPATLGFIEIDEGGSIKGKIIPVRNVKWTRKGWKSVNT